MKLIVDQVYIFGWTILIGMLIGMIFDLFRVWRKTFQIEDVFVYIQDALFWIVVTLIIIVSCFLINDGELRGYMLVGFLLGSIFYFLLFSRWLMKGLTIVVEGIKTVFHFVFWPFRKIWNFGSQKIKSARKQITNGFCTKLQNKNKKMVKKEEN